MEVLSRMDKEIDQIVQRCITKMGINRFHQEISNILDKYEEKDVLTIITNEGIHPRAPVHNRGDIYIASSGNIDFSSRKVVEAEFQEILKRVSRKLKSKPWKKVYLVPFGPAVLSMNIKLMVYRILHIETVDFLYVGHGEYYDLDIALRKIIADS